VVWQPGVSSVVGRDLPQRSLRHLAAAQGRRALSSFSVAADDLLPPTQLATSWTNQPGVPLLRLARRCEAGQTWVTLQQSSFSSQAEPLPGIHTPLASIRTGCWRFVAVQQHPADHCVECAAMNSHPHVTPLRLGLALVLLATTPALCAQQWVVRPATTVLTGEPLNIRLIDMPPGGQVQVQALRAVQGDDGSKRQYAASATFIADALGVVDLATQAPLQGSYSGADVRGLLWSMVPVPDVAALAADTSTNTITLVGDAKQPEGTKGALQSITQTIELMAALPQVQQRAAAPFPGAVFALLPGSIKRPALIVLGGSEGGSAITKTAPQWASRGFAVLALPYYSPPQWGPTGAKPAELPSLPAAFADIPVERLEQARAWLAQQPNVDATRIGVMGTSKGAEFALLAGVKMPWIKAIVAVVPSDVVWEGWGPDVLPGQRASFAWQGKPYDFVPYLDFDKEMAGFANGQKVRIRVPQDKGRAANPQRAVAARIPVERITAALMVIGGIDDQVWASGEMARNIVNTRRAAGLRTLGLIYDEGGHFLGGPGDQPTTQYNVGPYQAGGTPAGNARAQADAFAKTVQFLRDALGPVPP
jgi:BAAT / Acyl-CoA thioester hydrolase C terminal/Acyl-CoA thioester hydrolase/BAAT N-terminal region